MKSLFTNIQKQQIMLKTSLLLKKFTNFTDNNSRILKIKNAKFSGYCFYININIYRGFQICISVPLSNLENVLQGNLRKSRTRECIFRGYGDTNFEDFSTRQQPWWRPRGLDVYTGLPKNLWICHCFLGSISN